ncbi:hypothetical protein GDO86_006632 [Hymenochirus boettgeri]|uniref:Uncharacterized protein n=1 Tax=Hymenochirus boettgeri TaxID=247094 RepID=A0A8T2J6V4_9PIPI|nr:hypothetical protein GDO86_006632 [Hymenochirus boettgeri]
MRSVLIVAFVKYSVILCPLEIFYPEITIFTLFTDTPNLTIPPQSFLLNFTASCWLCELVTSLSRGGGSGYGPSLEEVAIRGVPVKGVMVYNYG